MNGYISATCGLHYIEPVNNAAEFGIMIGEKEFWNKGSGP